MAKRVAQAGRRGVETPLDLGGGRRFGLDCRAMEEECERKKMNSVPEKEVEDDAQLNLQKNSGLMFGQSHS